MNDFLQVIVILMIVFEVIAFIGSFQISYQDFLREPECENKLFQITYETTRFDICAFIFLSIFFPVIFIGHYLGQFFAVPIKK